MVLPPKVVHPNGDRELNLKKREIGALIADTFDGKIHIEWDPQAQVTPLGQLPFFIQFLKIGNLFQPWVDDCPLSYARSLSDLVDSNAYMLKILANSTASSV